MIIIAQNTNREALILSAHVFKDFDRFEGMQKAIFVDALEQWSLEKGYRMSKLSFVSVIFAISNNHWSCEIS